MKKHTLAIGIILTTLGFAGGAFAMSTFSDIAGHWAENNILWAAENRLVMGDEGRDTFRPNDGVTRAELVTILKRYDDMLNEKMELTKKGAELPPSDLQEKGYLYLGESKTSEDGQYTYTIYTKENNWCSPGYINENVPIHCLLRLVRANGEIILEVESNEKAEFKLNGESFLAPKDWYDNESLLISEGGGDGGLGYGSVKTYNVLTKIFDPIYSYEFLAGTGHLYSVDDGNFFFAEKKGGMDVYKVDESVHSLGDICLPDFYNCSELKASVITKINELNDATWVKYELGKGIGILLDPKSVEQAPDYIYRTKTNEFVPYSE